jgi:hypothetical protein
MNEPSFLSIAQRGRRKDRVPGSATEKCERDLLTVVLGFSNSNEIQQRTAMIEPSKGLHNRPIGAFIRALGRFRLCEPQFSPFENQFSPLPHPRSTDTLLFDIEVNLCCGAVLGDLLAVQFHF